MNYESTTDIGTPINYLETLTVEEIEELIKKIQNGLRYCPGCNTALNFVIKANNRLMYVYCQFGCIGFIWTSLI